MKYRLALTGIVLAATLSFGSASVLADELNYSSEQYSKVARVICNRIDRYKQGNSTAFPIKPKMCVAVPGMCDKGETHLDIRGIVRYTIAQGLRIKDADHLERNLVAILNEVLTYNCDVKSAFALSDVPFHHVKRNIAKRAIFTGQTASFFDYFIFKDYGYEEEGRKKMKIDINAVEMVDGEPETLLDYVDKALAPDHNTFLGYEQRGNVRDLRQKLLNRGAVNARNLDCQPGQKTGCKVAKAYREWEARAPQRQACRKECYPKKSDAPSHIEIPDTSSTWDDQSQVIAEFEDWYRPKIKRCDQLCESADPQP